MSRLHLAFACEGAELAATLDDADGRSGLLIVSGGNETRAGAFGGQAQLAAMIAAAGFPVFRFDRRGIGDSMGVNTGFMGSSADIAAAAQAFRAAAPQLERMVAIGNCDAASALMLSAGAGFDRIILCNPWTIEQDDGAPPPAAIRARYAEKLRNPKELLRLLSGKVSLSKLAKGALHALRPPPPPGTLAQKMAAGLVKFRGPASILLADRDRTAQAFEAAWDAGDPRIFHCPNASHAFVEQHARAWLFDQVIASLRD